MIHVILQPEPAKFDKEVRQKGLAHLTKKEIALDQPLPPKTELSPCWRACLDDLHHGYQGICAYLSVYIERVTGGSGVDHFIAKSKRADLAYEWDNYRLACSTMNNRKRDYDDVLDPFAVETGWFQLELVGGRIFPNPDLDKELQEKVSATIDRLGLDETTCREMRARRYQEYVEFQLPPDYLKRQSPFIWHEAKRLGVL